MSAARGGDERRTGTIPIWKREQVASFLELIEDYESVGVVNVQGIPSRQLQEMRAELYGTALLKMGRNTLIERALDEVGGGVEELCEYVSGHVGLIGTDDNPFALYKQLRASKTSAPIQAGEVAPNDIVVPEGDTGIDDLQMVGEFNNAGVNARPNDSRSLEVMEESVVTEAGEEVDADVASVLDAMGIEPKEVGLDLHAVFADGVIFEADELAIDEDAYRDDIQAAVAKGHKTAVNAGYLTDQTKGGILNKAIQNAWSLGSAASVLNPKLVREEVRQASYRASRLIEVIDYSSNESANNREEIIKDMKIIEMTEKDRMAVRGSICDEPTSVMFEKLGDSRSDIHWNSPVSIGGFMELVHNDEGLDADAKTEAILLPAPQEDEFMHGIAPLGEWEKIIGFEERCRFIAVTCEKYEVTWESTDDNTSDGNIVTILFKTDTVDIDRVVDIYGTTIPSIEDAGVFKDTVSYMHDISMESMLEKSGV